MQDCKKLTIDDELYKSAHDEGKLEYSTYFKRTDIFRLEQEGFIFKYDADEDEDTSDIIHATASWKKAFAGMNNPDYTPRIIAKNMITALKNARTKAFDITKSNEENSKAITAAQKDLLDELPQQISNEMRSKGIRCNQAMYLWITSLLNILIRIDNFKGVIDFIFT